MTKICMLSSGHSHVDDRIYYKEVLSLIKRYPKLSIAAPGQINLKNEIKKPEVNFVSLRMSGSILSRFLVIPHAIITMIRMQPHICHFHDFELVFALPLLRMFTKSKIIYDVHEVYPEMAEESKKIPRVLRPFISMMVNICEKNLSRLAHFIITTDENIAGDFAGCNKHIETIYNYPRLTIFNADTEKIDQLQEKYRNRTPIIYTGGMTENKGVFQMIKAMQIIKRSRPDVILLLLGPIYGDLKEKLVKEIANRGIVNNVDILGIIPHTDIVNYIYISKVGLIANLPTKKWHKNIPIKQFEYMACGVPVLGSNLPPIASYIKAARCGLVFDPNSYEALADGVLEILSDDKEWKRMSEAGRKAVQESWNWDRMEEKLFSVYEYLLGK